MSQAEDPALLRKEQLARGDRRGRAPADGRLHSPLRAAAAQPHRAPDRRPAARRIRRAWKASARSRAWSGSASRARPAARRPTRASAPLPSLRPIQRRRRADAPPDRPLPSRLQRRRRARAASRKRARSSLNRTAKIAASTTSSADVEQARHGRERGQRRARSRSGTRRPAAAPASACASDSRRVLAPGHLERAEHDRRRARRTGRARRLRFRRGRAAPARRPCRSPPTRISSSDSGSGCHGACGRSPTDRGLENRSAARARRVRARALSGLSG